jgi:hypothetical protein
MKSYHILSTHPKFEVEIPNDGTMKHPSKIPNSILANGELTDSHSKTASEKTTSS